ncbi:MAG: hypothetical protein HY673_02225 [Chloroflexi bacterium]|nr:hypothetical protein [Chloroflexota bacterium]
MTAHVVVAIALLVSLLSGGPASVLAADPGTIEGKVVNKTQGGPPVSNLKVTLKGYVNGKETSSKDAATDKDGKFSFKDVANDGGVTYIVTASYQEADYESDPVTFKRGETAAQLELVVWEATANGDAVGVQASHMVFYLDEGGLRVEEYIKVANGSDKTYIGAEVAPGVGRKKTLTFTMPDRAAGLQYIDGLMDCCVQKTDVGFFDTMAVPPDKGREIVFGYLLEYNSEVYTVSKPVDLPTKAFNVLVPDGGGIQLQSNLLKPRGSTPGSQGGTFRLYTAEQVPAGTVVDFTLSGLPKPKTKVNLKLIALLAGLMVVAVAISYPIFRKRNPAPVRVGTSLQSEKETLIAQIARLDDDYDAGKIRERDYSRMRAQRKARLTEVMRQLKRGGR